ncbi:hypothetical protein OJ996_15155 [Luteolibacter sp. GHJ8]|jgi:hypothetical protein|uniref:DUF2726 domain-containing protein n=1 Tax=Luteolibacter rhizosphaerae TaxID=2989719 RepID=A0ABT3G527_9BACT|nr:hypothetical protein [Luteolibacter rhizosphaerae]MCW1914925.1 hypothetical protein [Luteolibacter rhizosphaerae]
MDLPIAFSGLVLLIALTVWGLTVLLGWLIRRRLVQEYERLGESTSEEMLDELETAYSPRQTVRIHTQVEYLPYVFERVREITENGFDDKQMLSLLERIETHRPNERRQAVFPIEVSGKRSDLHFQWTRDASDRIELRVIAAPRIARALREQKKKIPKAVLAR